MIIIIVNNIIMIAIVIIIIIIVIFIIVIIIVIIIVTIIVIINQALVPSKSQLLEAYIGMTYGVVGRSQLWLFCCLKTPAITATNNNLSSVESIDMYMNAFS